MKQILSSRTLDIPSGVEVECKSRAVRVKGPRGTLSRDFRHLKLDLSLKTNEDGVLQLVVESWYGSRKSLASIRSVCSHVSNLIVGVTQGFRYKMRMVYAHFPINTNIESSGQKIELRNFLGEKRVSIFSARKMARLRVLCIVCDALALAGSQGGHARGGYRGSLGQGA